MNSRIILSDSPLEYMLAVSMVFMPASHAALRIGRAFQPPSGGDLRMLRKLAVPSLQAASRARRGNQHEGPQPQHKEAAYSPTRIAESHASELSPSLSITHDLAGSIVTTHYGDGHAKTRLAELSIFDLNCLGHCAAVGGGRGRGCARWCKPLHLYIRTKLLHRYLTPRNLHSGSWAASR